MSLTKWIQNTEDKGEQDLSAMKESKQEAINQVERLQSRNTVLMKENERLTMENSILTAENRGLRAHASRPGLQKRKQGGKRN